MRPPRFTEIPCTRAPLSDPGEISAPGPRSLATFQRFDVAFRIINAVGSHGDSVIEAPSRGPRARCLRFAARIAPVPRQTRFRMGASLVRDGSLCPSGILRTVSAHLAILRSCASWRTDPSEHGAKIEKPEREQIDHPLTLTLTIPLAYAERVRARARARLREAPRENRKVRARPSLEHSPTRTLTPTPTLTLTLRGSDFGFRARSRARARSTGSERKPRSSDDDRGFFSCCSCSTRRW